MRAVTGLARRRIANKAKMARKDLRKTIFEELSENSLEHVARFYTQSITYGSDANLEKKGHMHTQI